MMVVILQAIMLLPVGIILIVGAGAIACYFADVIRAIIAGNEKRWRR